MKLYWLGQAGFYLAADHGTAIMIDPYLSDSLLRDRGEKYHREVPVNEEFLKARVDVLVITHAHADHMDLATLDQVFTVNHGMAVMAPRNVLSQLRARYGELVNYMLFEPGVEITINGILFRASYACHSDECPIGVIMEGEGKVLCHTGDTMFHTRLIKELPVEADLLMLPINGVGNNMNAVDAARLARSIRPRLVMPMHWDMFKAYGCDVELFCNQWKGDAQRILLPSQYQEIEL